MSPVLPRVSFPAARCCQSSLPFIKIAHQGSCESHNPCLEQLLHPSSCASSAPALPGTGNNRKELQDRWSFAPSLPGWEKPSPGLPWISELSQGFSGKAVPAPPHPQEFFIHILTEFPKKKPTHSFLLGSPSPCILSKPSEKSGELEKEPLWSLGFQVRDCWDAPQVVALAVEQEMRLCWESPGIGRARNGFPSVFPLLVSISRQDGSPWNCPGMDMECGSNEINSRLGEGGVLLHWDFSIWGIRDPEGPSLCLSSKGGVKQWKIPHFQCCSQLQCWRQLWNEALGDLPVL